MKREKLRQARIKKGLSQQVAAELIGVSRNAWSLWERGKEDPYPVNVKELCTFFGVDDPGDLDLAPRPMSVSKDEKLRSSITRTMVTAIAENYSQEDGIQQKETYLQFSNIIKQNIISTVRELLEDDREQLRHQLLQLHTEDLLDIEPYERLKYVLRRPSAVDNATLDHLENITNDCWKMIPVVSGIVSHHSRKYAQEHLKNITRVLEGSHPTMTHKRLCSIAGKLSLIVANISSNMRDYKTAKIYYEISIEAGQEASNTPLQAVGLARLSFNATRSDRPDMALPFIQAADSLMKQSGKYATITTRSWINAALAEVYANLNDSKLCFEALEYAELQTIPTAPEDDPYYTTFSPSLLAGYKGVCYMLLRLPEDAEKVLNGALEQLPASSIYQKGYILCDLAKAYIQQGNLEEMYKHANGALVAAIQTKAPEIFQRISKLQNDFNLWASTSYVKNLETQIHDLEPYFSRIKG